MFFVFKNLMNLKAASKNSKHEKVSIQFLDYKL